MEPQDSNSEKSSDSVDLFNRDLTRSSQDIHSSVDLFDTSSPVQAVDTTSQDVKV
jgi:hypothetical protein